MCQNGSVTKSENILFTQNYFIIYLSSPVIIDQHSQILFQATGF